MDWIGVPSDINDYLGFVYIIRHNNSNKYYIGQKKFWFKSTKRLAKKPTKVESSRLEKYKLLSSSKYIKYNKKLKDKYKGKKKKIRSFVESDWKEYYGSSNKFNAFIEKEGKENFTRTILYLCETKSEMSWLEMIEQVKYDVLNDSDSYNGIIAIRLNRTK